MKRMVFAVCLVLVVGFAGYAGADYMDMPVIQYSPTLDCYWIVKWDGGGGMYIWGPKPGGLGLNLVKVWNKFPWGSAKEAAESGFSTTGYIYSTYRQANDVYWDALDSHIKEMGVKYRKDERWETIQR